jgi:hypothetical protein
MLPEPVRPAARISATALLLLVVCAARFHVTVRTQPVARGGEFQLNVYTTGDQLRPRVGMDEAGNFVVVWRGGFDQDGSHFGLTMRRFDASGFPRSAESPVATYTTGPQTFADIAMNPAGDFVVVWQRISSTGSYGVFARRFDATAQPTGDEFQVSPVNTANHQRARVALDGNGGFTIVWDSRFTNGSAEILARRYDQAGTALGAEFQVNTHTTGDQMYPDVAADASGRYTVVWRTDFHPGDVWNGVVRRRYEADGTPAGVESLVNTYTTDHQLSASIAVNGAGASVAAWEDRPVSPGGDGQDGSRTGVYAARFDTTGAAAGGNFLVPSYTTALQSAPAVLVHETGDFVVAWEGGAAGQYRAMSLRGFDATGMPAGDQLLVNTSTTATLRSRVSVAHHTAGGFVVVWDAGEASSFTPDGSGAGIFARRFLPDVLVADDFESGNLGAWSMGSQTDGGDLSVQPGAALKGTGLGLSVAVDDQAPLYVLDESPVDEGRYRVRFWLDPNGFDPGIASQRYRVRVMLGLDDSAGRVITLVLRRTVTLQFALMARVRRDDGTRTNTGFTNISDGPHLVELEWWRATAPGASDGQVMLWIDGALAGTATGVDSDTTNLDQVRIGAMSIKLGASGVLFIDEVESWRPVARTAVP